MEQVRRLSYANIIVYSVFLLLTGGCEKSTNPLKEKPVAAVQVKNARISILYGSQATKIQGDIKQSSGERMIWKGKGSLSWDLNVEEAGDYVLSLCYSKSLDAPETSFEMVGKENSIEAELKATRGYFSDPLLNYERVHTDEKIRLPKGKSTLLFNLNEVQEDFLFHFRSIELLPVSAQEKITETENRAKNSRATTDWLVEAKYGVMFHWTSRSEPPEGNKLSYAQAVDNFRVENFCDMVEKTGAGYIIFTANHADPHFPAPLKEWEKVHPGWTTERDLISELADGLHKKNIRLMIYLATHTLAKYPEASEEEFNLINKNIITEIGNKYGEKISGYWFDGWYQCFESYPNVSFEEFFRICKTGNPQRIIALNSWIYPLVTEWQEYWAGEVASPILEPDNRYFTFGPAKDLQYQALLIMEPYWVHKDPNTPMASPRFNAENLSEYIQKCTASDGVVTINLGIFQDGTIGKEALEVMKIVRENIRGR